MRPRRRQNSQKNTLKLVFVRDNSMGMRPEGKKRETPRLPPASEEREERETTHATGRTGFRKTWSESETGPLFLAIIAGARKDKGRKDKKKERDINAVSEKEQDIKTVSEKLSKVLSAGMESTSGKLEKERRAELAKRFSREFEEARKTVIPEVIRLEELMKRGYPFKPPEPEKGSLALEKEGDTSIQKELKKEGYIFKPAGPEKGILALKKGIDPTTLAERSAREREIKDKADKLLRRAIFHLITQNDIKLKTMEPGTIESENIANVSRLAWSIFEGRHRKLAARYLRATMARERRERDFRTIVNTISESTDRQKTPDAKATEEKQKAYAEGRLDQKISSLRGYIRNQTEKLARLAKQKDSNPKEIIEARDKMNLAGERLMKLEAAADRRATGISPVSAWNEWIKEKMREESGRRGIAPSDETEKPPFKPFDKWTGEEREEQKTQFGKWFKNIRKESGTAGIASSDEIRKILEESGTIGITPSDEIRKMVVAKLETDEQKKEWLDRVEAYVKRIGPHTLVDEKERNLVHCLLARVAACAYSEKNKKASGIIESFANSPFAQKHNSISEIRRIWEIYKAKLGENARAKTPK